MTSVELCQLCTLQNIYKQLLQRHKWTSVALYCLPELMQVHGEYKQDEMCSIANSRAIILGTLVIMSDNVSFYLDKSDLPLIHCQWADGQAPITGNRNGQVHDRCCHNNHKNIYWKKSIQWKTWSKTKHSFVSKDTTAFKNIQWAKAITYFV